MPAKAFDRERSAIFLEKADVALPDAHLAGLRDRSDAELGIDEALLREAVGAFGLPASSHTSRAVSQGTFHRLYDVEAAGREPRLLRVAAMSGERWTGLMSLEARLGAMLAAAGLPVPACEFRELGQAPASRGAQLMTRTSGTSLADFDHDEARMTASLAWVGRFLRVLHRLRGSGHGPLSLAALEGAEPRLEGLHRHWDDYVLLRLEDHLSDCEAAGDLTREEAAQARERLAAARGQLRAQPSVLLHGDPGSHNFIVDEQAIRAVIDWEDALLGDPLFELASLCTFHPERRHAAIHAGYGAELARGGEAWERFWLYFLRIALAKTVHRRRFGYADKPGRPPAARRIQLALERLQGARP